MAALTRKQSFNLVSEGQGRATIVAPEYGAARYAADLLQSFIRRMTGVELPIAAEAKPPRVIIRVAPGAARHDGFRILRRGGELIVEVGLARGCVYGVCELLERMGCRFTVRRRWGLSRLNAGAWFFQPRVPLAASRRSRTGSHRTERSSSRFSGVSTTLAGRLPRCRRSCGCWAFGSINGGISGRNSSRKSIPLFVEKSCLTRDI